MLLHVTLCVVFFLVRVTAVFWLKCHILLQELTHELPVHIEPYSLFFTLPVKGKHHKKQYNLLVRSCACESSETN